MIIFSVMLLFFNVCFFNVFFRTCQYTLLRSTDICTHGRNDIVAGHIQFCVCVLFSEGTKAGKLTLKHTLQTLVIRLLRTHIQLKRLAKSPARQLLLVSS